MHNTGDAFAIKRPETHYNLLYMSVGLYDIYRQRERERETPVSKPHGNCKPKICNRHTDK